MITSPMLSNTVPTSDGTNATNKKSIPFQPPITLLNNSGPEPITTTETIKRKLKRVHMTRHQRKFLYKHMTEKRQ